MRTEVVPLPVSVVRLAILGDPHGDVAGVTAIFAREETPETRFACVGDVVGYADGPRSSELCSLLASRRVTTVQGNHEDWVGPLGELALVESRSADRRLTPSALDWVRALPDLVHFVREGVEAPSLQFVGPDITFSDGAPPPPPDGLKAVHARSATRFAHAALGLRAPVATLIHSIRDPYWDWIGEENVTGLVDNLGWPQLLVTGHSHRPKFIVVGREGSVRRLSYDYLSNESSACPLNESGSLIVDAGSVGRPEATETAGAKRPHDGARFGTYAVIDFKSRVATLRRIQKD